jgi:hypothetical protein
MGRIINSAGSTFRKRAGGGNFVTRKRSDDSTKVLEGVWLPSGTGEANLGSKGTVDADIAGGATVQAGKPNRSKGQSVNFSPNKRRVSKGNAGSSGSQRALNIV